MAFGDYAFGQGFYGEDPLGSPPPPRAVEPPAAILFDGVGAKNILLDDGLYKEIHPVDQQVALSLLVTLGTLSSVPELGAAIRSIVYLDQRTESKVRDAVNRSLETLVQDEKIEVLSVETQIEPRPSGRLLVYVNYRNLFLATTNNVTSARRIQVRTYAS